MKIALPTLLLILFSLISTDILSQVRLRVRIDNGSSTTTCTDGFFGGAPDPQWRVNVDNQGWTTYPSSGICFNNPPNTQYDEVFNCANRYPALLEVCFRAFEDDGGACIVSESCRETTCQNFATPAPGTSISYTLSTAGSSTGTVNFTISATGSFNLPGGAYNNICNAVNLGNLVNTSTIGNRNLSNYGNFCADNLAEPNPWGGDNDQGVWFQFTTGATPAAVIEIEANSDPQNIGNDIDLQLALYESSNNTCSGTLTLIEDAYNGLGLFNDEDMSVNCLKPNTTYFLMVDGENTNLINTDGQEGYFGVEIRDGGVLQAGDLVCDAEFLGLIPAGGQVATPNLSRSNICASNAGDPNPGAWASDKTVWFRFQAPPSGHVIIDADSDLPWPIGTDAVDLQLAAYGSSNNSCTGTLTNLGSDYTPGLFGETMEVRCLTPGENYWVMVDGSPLNVDGIFDLTIRDGGIFPAPNDLICDAIPLGAPAPNGTVGLNNQNNYCADNLFEPVPSSWGNNQGVWYTFIAPPSGKVEVRLDNGGIFSTDNMDLQVAVYDLAGMVCTGVPNEIKSEHEGIGILWDEDMEVECLIPGREYWILVDGEGSLIDPDLQVGIFDIEVWADPRDLASPYDLPCNALALGDPTGTTIGTTPGPLHGSQNNFCATATGEPQPSQFTADQTVWYTFVAPSTGNVNIQLTSDAIFGGVDAINLQIAVYKAASCNGPFREHTSGDDLVYDVDLDVFCLNPGEIYYVQIDGSPPNILEGQEGYFDISITEIPSIPVAPNDLICNATALGDPWAAPVSILNQHNLCADDLGDPNPSAFGTDQTVWYSFTTPATGGPYAIDIDANSSLPWPFGSQDAIDLQLAVYESSNNLCTGSLTEIQSEYDFIDLFDESMRVSCLEENKTYFLMVDGSFIDVQGYFDLSLSAAPAVPIPTNNMICQHENLGAVPVGGSINNGVSYFNYCADTESGEPSPFGIEQTVWFSFVAPNHTGPNATADVTIRVNSDPANLGDDVDLQLAVYESSNNLCTGAMRLLEDGDSDPLFSFNADVNVTCLYPGRRYWVQVDGTIINPEGYFQIEVRDDGAGVRPPYNILCNAEHLGTVPNGGQINNGIDYLNLCSDTEPGEPSPTAFSIEKTVWFSFVAPASGNVQIDGYSDPNNLGDDVDIELALYYSSDNTCTGTLLEVDSDHDAFNKDERLNVDCLEAGRIYYLQVDGNDGAFGDEDGYFTLRVRDDGGTSNFPYNNDICNAFNFGTPTGVTQSRNGESNVCANVEPNEPGVGGYATHTVWYQFTAPPSGRVEIDVVSTNLFLGMDPEVRLFGSSNNSCTGSLNRLETSNWPTALIPENIEATCLIPGNTYFIQVDGSGLNLEGTFDIDIEDMLPTYGTGVAGDPEPTNNGCNDAITLPVQASSCLNANGTFQTLNYGYPTISYNPAFAQGCGGNCGDTWYQFTMPASGNAVIEGNDDAISGSGPLGDFSELVVAAYSGSCNNLTPISCDNGGFTSDVSIQIAAPAGTTVWLQVFNDDGDDDNENYQLCVSEGCGYDDCLTSLVAPIQPNVAYCFNTAGAGGENIPSDPGYNECSEGDSPEHSLYYYFVSDCNGSDVTLHVMNATANGNCILGITPSDGFNISLFQDATPCDANPDTLVDCQQFTACDVQPINWSQTYTGLRPSTPYMIQIDGGFGSLGGDNAGEIMITTTTDPVVTVNSTPVACSGTNNGTAIPTVQGGVGPFTFSWSTGQTDSIISGLNAGTYYVTATGSNGCEDSAQVVVDSGSIMVASIVNTVDVACSGDCSGQATATGIGGTITTNYTYLWDAAAGGQTTNTATGLCIGTYSVTVYDNNGCFDSTTATISTPNPIIAALDSTQDASCDGICDGIGYLSATGGTILGSYVYTWPAGQSTATVTGLCAGSYLVTVSDDNGCTDTVRVDITQPTGVIASIANQTNINCGGDSTGSIEILAQNGTPNYTYTLYNNTGQLNTGTNHIFTNLWADNYGILVQDMNGCQDSLAFSITAPNALVLSLVSSMDLSCNGADDGEIIVSATGGLLPYSYAIDGINFNANSTFSNLAAGNYTIQVRDANNCIDSIPVTITTPAAINIALNGQTIASCGACDATASITVSGGAGGFSYLWSNGETVQNPVALCAGSNTVTVTDANSCSNTLTISINNSSNFTVTTNIDQVISCNGDCNGAISITPPALGQPSYLWSNGNTNNSLTGLCAGNYTATISDTSGCFVVETIALTEPDPLTTLVAQTQAVSCNGGSDGQATATPSGGTMAYNYLWSNGETNQNAIALNAGSHDVTVTDQNGCSITGSVSISEPTVLAINISNIITSDCGTGTCNGEATATTSGGAAPYTYLWSNGNTTTNPTDLCPNFNGVTVTDASGCTATTNVNIPANSNLNLSLINTALPTCYGDCDGQAIVSASGGNTTVPYTFTWNNGQSTALATGLCTGTYFVTVADTDGCSAAMSVVMTQPDSLIASSNITNTITCFGANDGTAIATAQGGTTNYSYSWSNNQNSATATNLGATTYTVTITDGNGCQDTNSITLVAPTPVVVNTTVTSSYNGVQISCADGNDGTAQATASGGTGTYTYQWINGETTANITGLQASSYPITVTDANGCEGYSSVTLTHPPQLVISTNITSNYNGYNVSCHNGNDGVVQVSTSGGTGAISFIWSDGQTTTTATGMNAGTYAVTATDINGCWTMDTDSLTAPPALEDTLVLNQAVLCFGQNNGQVQAIASGGLPTYQFAWDNGETTATAIALSTGNHSVSITDINGCLVTNQIYVPTPVAIVTNLTTTNASCFGYNDGNIQAMTQGGTSPYTFAWSNGQTNSDATNLLAGNYSVVITDANGCLDSATATITAPTAVIATASLGNAISCNGASDGTATVNASGGAGFGYSYLWSNNQNTSTATGLSAGTYYVTVTDIEGCFGVDSITLTDPSSVIASAVISSNYNGANVSCFGANDGSATAIPSGGTTPYSFAWSDGQSTAIANNLASGNYIVNITDANGCADTALVTLTNPAPTGISVRLSQHVSCHNGNDGIAQAVAFGGTAPYSYLWSNGTTSFSATNLTAGQHGVTITDANGCQSTGTITILSPLPIYLDSTASTIVSCHGGSNGSLAVYAAGGAGGYTYLWSNGQTGNVALGLTVGMYDVTVTDQVGCTAVFQEIVTQPQPLALSFTNIINIDCHSYATGSATPQPSGGVAPYSYVWNNNLAYTNYIPTYLVAGYNQLQVADANGCIIRDSVLISSPPPFVINPSSSNVSCLGDSTGTAAINATGGVTPYIYQWSNGANTDSISNLAPNTLYSFTVTDANNCETKDAIYIQEPNSSIEATFTQVTNIDCAGQSNGVLEATAQNGTSPYTFFWSNNVYKIDNSSSTIGGLNAGTYSVIITDDNGCETRIDTLITDPDLLRVVGTGNRLKCFGDNNGTITMTATGGKPPYVYYRKSGTTVLGQSSNTIVNLTGGTYTIGVQDANGCTFETTATVSQPDSVLLETSPDVSIRFGESTHLFVRMPVNSPTNPVVTWSPATGLTCTDCYQPVAQPFEPTLYTVTITGDEGCVSTAQVFVDVNTEKEVYIPNAFSPNDDGTNDVFMLYSAGAVDVIEEFIIFDRWGEMICSRPNGKPNYPAYGWDGTFRGKKMNTGVLIYYIKVRYLDGSTEIFKGDLTLLR